MYGLKRKLSLTDTQECRVRDRVLALSQRERLIIQMYFWEQYSEFQIARKLSISVKDVPTIMQGAFDRLRRDFFDIAEIYFETYRASNNFKYRGV